ncbi:MAG: hypothetical protein RBR62_07790 [Bacteroidales bacterium]|jgi:hypothetical protein|nr:hypothetical protein [Bacteroidales bacterium]
MKLYAVRDKKSGTFWEYDDVADDFELSSTWATAWQIKEDVFGPEYIANWAKRKNVEVGNLEYVTFREEPTEPCEWCDVNDGAWCATYDGRMIALDNEGSPETLLAENWSFCPNCGRGLA